jgi:quinolinate synthase
MLESPEIIIDKDLMDKARKPIVRMLEISEKLHL